MISNHDSKGLERKVHEVDPSLEFLCMLGWGTYGDVAKVASDGKVYALKISNYNSDGFVEEFEMQKELNGVVGVPEAKKLYSPQAFLMQFIYGRELNSAGGQSRLFFYRLRRIAMEINERGYSLPLDLHDYNVMVGYDGSPWIIDFAFSLPINKKELEMEAVTNNYLIGKLESKYMVQ